MMNSVRCPICERRVSAGTAAGLSDELRVHLSVEHDMDVQGRSGKASSPMTEARGSGTGTEVSRPDGERGLRGAQHRREEQFWAPEEGTKIPPRPRGMTDWVRKSVGATEEAGGREEWTRGKGYPSMMQRSSPRTETLACPMCGREVMGRGEEELSQALEDHFRAEHRIVPRVAQR